MKSSQQRPQPNGSHNQRFSAKPTKSGFKGPLDQHSHEDTQMVDATSEAGNWKSQYIYIYILDFYDHKHPCKTICKGMVSELDTLSTSQVSLFSSDPDHPRNSAPSYELLYILLDHGLDPNVAGHFGHTVVTWFTWFQEFFQEMGHRCPSFSHQGWWMFIG